MIGCKTLFYISCIFLASMDGNNVQRSWYLKTKISLIECDFKGVEQTSTKDGVVRVVHVDHIEGDIFSSCILEAAEGY
jgi:hypothetical protein